MSEEEQNAEIGKWTKERATKDRELACIEQKLQRFFGDMKRVAVSFSRNDFPSIEVHGDTLHIGKSRIEWIDFHEIGSMSDRAAQLHYDLDELEDKLKRAGVPIR